MLGPILRALLKMYGPTIARTLINAARQVVQESGSKGINIYPKAKLRKMNRDEAKKILGVSGYDNEETLMMYKKLFELNDPAKGGSFYLQCKVLGAMETLNSKDK